MNSFSENNESGLSHSINNLMDYWNKVAKDKVFTHPLNSVLLEKYVNKNAMIIDYGCGYGRIVKELYDAGFKKVSGFDFSVELINRGIKNGIDNIFQIDSVRSLLVDNNTVDCFLLFAVLTCIPDNKSQIDLLATLFAKLKTKGIVYISDYYLQTLSIEVDNYSCLNANKDNFGVFTLQDGAIFRHHTQEWIRFLLKDFQIVEENLIDVKTMNGNHAKAFQIIAIKQ